MPLDLDALVREALARHETAIYEACQPSMSPWPEDPDGGLLRFSGAITEVLDTCRDLENEGMWDVPREVRLRLAVALGVLTVAV